MHKVTLADKFDRFSDHWRPRIVGRVNETHIKVAKLQGEFPWHAHEHEDELFLVVRGSIRIEFRHREVVLNEGEFLIVPRGMEHRPVADTEAHVLLVEPVTTVNTGNVVNDKTVAELEWI